MWRIRKDQKPVSLGLPDPRELDSQALAALGAACVDHGAATTGFHADQKTMGASTADFGGLCGYPHRLPEGNQGEMRHECRSIAPNTIRGTRHYRKFSESQQHLSVYMVCSTVRFGFASQNKLTPTMTQGLPPHTPDTHSQELGQSLWQSCVDQLAQELPEQQFNTWIKPLAAQVHDDMSKATIFVANRFKLDWIRTQYAARITALLEALQGTPVALELVLAPREGPSRTSPTPRTAQEQVLAELPDLAPAEVAVPSGPKTRLNPALAFSTLVEGSANRMGRAAAMHVASSLGQLYNPLFIYGGVGLGKTHLVHAIGNKLLADNPNAKVLYIHA
eukprot:gene16602-34583_t